MENVLILIIALGGCFGVFYVIARILGKFLDYVKQTPQEHKAWDKERKPMIQDFTVYKDSKVRYDRAMAEWKEAHEPPLESLPIVKRLKKRNPKRHDVHATLDSEYCFICGGPINYNYNTGRDECRDCNTRYRNTPKGPLPEGIPEGHRYQLWKLQQAIIVDLHDGKLDEKAALDEMEEAAEHVRSWVNKAKQTKAKRLEQERKLKQEQDDLIELSARLLPK